MDNQDYLNQIAVTPKVNTGLSQVFTPKTIKIIIGGLVSLTLIIILGLILNNLNSKNINLYERYCLRLQNLSSQNGVITEYTKDLKSSDLRSLASTLHSSLFVTATNWEALADTLHINLDSISPKASESESLNLAGYKNKLYDAKLNGLLDRTFASATALQISEILAMESEIKLKNKDSSVLNVVNKSSENLEILYQKFYDFANSH